MKRQYHRWADGRFRRKYERPPRKGTWARTVHDTAQAYLRVELKRVLADLLKQRRLLELLRSGRRSLHFTQSWNFAPSF